MDVGLSSRPNESDSPAVARLADLQERVRHIESRMTTIRNEIHQITKGLLSQQEAEVAMFSFDAVWESMTLRDQIRLIGLVVKQVDYDGESGRVTITFNPIGIRNRAQHATKDLTEVPA